MDQVLLPTTWAYPDKTILQIIQARTKQQPQHPKNATKRWKLLEAENSTTVAAYTPSMRRARTSLFYGRPWKRQTLHGYLPVPWLLRDMGLRSWVNPGKLVGMLGISERVPLALENVGDCQECQNASQTCAAEIYCQDSSNSNSRAVVKSLTRFTTFHLKQSCACKACTLKTAILALQFNCQFNLSHNLIWLCLLLWLIAAGARETCTAGGWRPTRDPLTGRRVQWMEQCELMRKKIPWARLEKRPKFISMPWRST